MNIRPSILCPIDYSDASAGALRYAAAIADDFVTRLIVLTVEDPLLSTVLDLGTGVHWTRERSERELSAFVTDLFEQNAAALAMCEYDVAVGKPAVEILRVARERSCDLIVMSSHGSTGARKLFFGSTTERVLRETAVPVLVTPPANPGPIHVADARRLVGRIVVPVDLSAGSLPQTRVAGGLADALNLPVVLVHVIEPVRSRLLSRLYLTGLNADRRASAEDALDDLAAALPPSVRWEALIVHGDPAEEAAKVVRDRGAGLVVMGLHASPLRSPRLGSVTYRFLCLTQALVLALPPNTHAGVENGTPPMRQLAER
jgi:nucleotide-binding universal stress UspA family protein